METDKVLQRMELESKKKVLEIVKQQAIKHDLYIKTPRGIYKLPLEALIDIVDDTNGKILLINKQIEELTGLNQEKIKRLYEV